MRVALRSGNFMIKIPHNGKLTGHLLGLVVGPLVGIFLYSLFPRFNIICRGRGNRKLASDKKDP